MKKQLYASWFQVSFLNEQSRSRLPRLARFQT